MSEVLQKYARFVDLLLEKTKLGKIPWTYDSPRDTISLWNDNVLCTLSKGSDENFEDTYSLALINKSGDYLESFTDGTLSNIKVEFGQDNYYVRMKDLYDVAMRQSTGADKALDDFMSAVENDDLIPF